MLPTLFGRADSLVFTTVSGRAGSLVFTTVPGRAGGAHNGISDRHGVAVLEQNLAELRLQALQNIAHPTSKISVASECAKYSLDRDGSCDLGRELYRPPTRPNRPTPKVA